MEENNISKNIEDEIPKELIDIVQDEKTAAEIARTCSENKIEEEEQIKEISHQIGRVLVGDLLPQEFSKTLEEKTKISPFLAEKISREISESIFYPVKESLSALYGNEIILPEKSSISSSEIIEERPEKIKRPEEIKKVGGDTYREPIE